MLQSGTVYVSMSKEHKQSKSGKKLTVPAKDTSYYNQETQ